MKKEKSTRKNAQKCVIAECMPANIHLTASDITARMSLYIMLLSRAEKYLVEMMIQKLHQRK